MKNYWKSFTKLVKDLIRIDSFVRKIYNNHNANVCVEKGQIFISKITFIPLLLLSLQRYKKDIEKLQLITDFPFYD